MYFGDDDDLPIGGEPTDDPNLDDDDNDDIPGTEEPDPDLPAQEEEPAAPAPPRKMTANEVIRATKAKLRQAEMDLAAERAVRSREPAPARPDPAIAAAAERQRLEEMSEVDRVQYMAQRVQQQTDIQLQQMRLEWQIEADKRLFKDTVTAVPEYAKYEDAVEQEFKACLQRGQPRTRDELLSIAIGNEVKANRAAAVSKARRAATKNIAAHTTRPVSVRSGVGGSVRGEEKSPEEVLASRLESGEYWR
jgi:hypothetical protein